MAEVTIPDELVERIEARIDHTEFESADAYAEFVLSEVLTRVEREASGTEPATTPRDEVESRLQSLGYLEE